MPTYTRNNKNTPGKGMTSTTQALAREVADKQAKFQPAKTAFDNPTDSPYQLQGGGPGDFKGPLGGPGNKSAGRLEDPRETFRKNAQKQAAVESAKAKARKEMEEKAKAAAAEVEQGIDLNGDGVIGSGIEGMAGGRQMTEEDAIRTAIRNLLLEQPDVAAERQAMIDEMKVNQARAIQSARARTGLGGMGLTGGAGALESQVRRETAREQALTTAQFDRAAREEALRRLMTGIEARRGEQVFDASMEMYEQEADFDINGDGFIAGKPVGGEIGDRDPTNNPGKDGEGPVSEETGLPEDTEERNDAVSRLQVRGRGFAGVPPLQTDDPWISGPHEIDGKTYYVYRRQDNGQLYRSRTPPQPDERPAEGDARAPQTVEEAYGEDWGAGLWDVTMGQFGL